MTQPFEARDNEGSLEVPREIAIFFRLIAWFVVISRPFTIKSLISHANSVFGLSYSTMKHFPRYFFGAALIVAICAGTIPQSSSLQAAVTEIPVYTLGAGDKVKVSVFGESDLSGEFEIGGDGSIAIPLVGKTHSSGMSVDQFEREGTERNNADREFLLRAAVADLRMGLAMKSANRPGWRVSPNLEIW
ncbi:MAG: polysaccharide biosynthesis/export family protein [Rhodospirillales bacterium]|nr:polysaccharide biosynthesis/export family protein [Rhodospirillales bacterium]